MLSCQPHCHYGTRHDKSSGSTIHSLLRGPIVLLALDISIKPTTSNPNQHLQASRLGEGQNAIVQRAPLGKAGQHSRIGKTPSPTLLHVLTTGAWKVCSSAAEQASMKASSSGILETHYERLAQQVKY